VIRALVHLEPATEEHVRPKGVSGTGSVLSGESQQKNQIDAFPENEKGLR